MSPSQKKKVVVNLVALHGGGPAYSLEMTKGLAANGCQIMAVLSPKMDNYEKWKEIEGIEIVDVAGYSTKKDFITGLIKYVFRDYWKVRKAARRFKPDFAYVPIQSFWTEFIQKALKGIPLAYTMHDVYPHDGVINYIWKQSERVARSADTIIILSDCFREDIRKNYGFDDDHILVVPHGNYFDGQINKKPDDGLFHFVFYGRITEYKGLNILAEAFSSIEDKYDNVRLLVAGNGDFSAYKEAYDALDEKRVTVINRWIDDSEVEGFFEANRSICVLPYINATQSGVIPLAMHVKSLVLTTDCSGLVEQVEDGKTGYIVKANDAKEFSEKMDYIINHWDESEIIVDRAYERIESLTWDNITKIIIDHYN